MGTIEIIVISILILCCTGAIVGVYRLASELDRLMKNIDKLVDKE